MIEGGGNDKDDDPGLITRRAVKTLKAAAKRHPEARLVLVGTMDPTVDSFTDTDGVIGALAAAADRLGIPYINAQHWLEGRQDLVGPDYDHPTPAGHRVCGASSARALRALRPSACGRASASSSSRSRSRASVSSSASRAAARSAEARAAIASAAASSAATRASIASRSRSSCSSAATWRLARASAVRHSAVARSLPARVARSAWAFAVSSAVRRASWASSAASSASVRAW